MEPGVPFALLGAVQLLLVVSTLGVAASGWLRRSTPGALLALGALALAAVEIRTALRLGSPASDNLALARAAGSLALAAGLYGGGLGRRTATATAAATTTSTPTLGVVVPLAATGGPAAFAATAGALAALAVVATRRDAAGYWFAGGLALWALASGLAPLADHGQGGALTVVLARGAGALAVLVGLSLLAQVSLLSKVVSAILAGVVTMAVAAVGVVGTVVVSSYDSQARETVQNAADARLAAIGDVATSAQGEARLAALACTDAEACGSFLTQIVVNGQGDFVVRVRRGHAPESLGGRPPLTASEVVGIRSLTAVQQVLSGAGGGRLDLLKDTVRLTGQAPRVAVIGVAAGARRTGQDPPDSVVIYGVRIDNAYTQNDLDLGGGYNLSLLAGDPLQVVASNLTANKRVQLLTIVKQHGTSVPETGVTIGSQGANPTVALRPVLDNAGSKTVALLAMTREPGPALRTERDALRLLLVTSLLALVLVALSAVLLGRRTIDPVRRLTAAAERVAAGDLSASVGVSTRDEVGTLARTFDTMTGSLGRLTGDLRDAAARLETVLASMTDGLLATDGTGAVTSVNRAALAMLGVDEADVLGEQLDVVADVRDAAGSPLVDLDAVVLDEPAEVHRPDGTTVSVRVVLTPLNDSDGVVLVLRDTTREREVERMKTEFLSNVSHELRTPLTPIRGYAEILVSKPGLEQDKVKAFATTIRDESLKMNRVVDLLVDVASFEAGRVHGSPRAVPVKELLDARVKVWRERVPKREFKRRVAAGLPAVLVDPSWLAKALDELIDNAVKHAPTGPVNLTAALSPDGERVRVAVRDQGPGIAAGDESKLFTSFEQVDGSVTRRVGGLGLGLSFVRRLAEDAGFPMSVSSTEGKGAEFALDLPIA
ncbi:MAG TPA: ATP-binding protein [Mycobacteriales bacterium]|nr:ATP-binding protein [Mycobacteriales bacterium]